MIISKIHFNGGAGAAGIKMVPFNGGALCSLKLQHHREEGRVNVPVNVNLIYSLVRLVWPNTEELISQPFMGLSKIRLLLQDSMSPKNVR